MKNVFIIGSKGIPAKYGGFETFVDKLTEFNNSNQIKYHVACLSDINNEFEYNNARCFNIKVPNIGPVKAVYFDIAAFKSCIDFIEKNSLENSIIYVLACRIGPFFKKLVKKAHQLGTRVYVNPDGHEWLRGKWSLPIKKYWKYSECLMIKHADLVICDSEGIVDYIKKAYARYAPKTTYIAYGADLSVSRLTDNSETFTSWKNKFQLLNLEYYLVIGRFVPENNYASIIRGFHHSKTKKKLILITHVDNDKFFRKLMTPEMIEDKRICFVGTVYDQDLLKKIREKAYAYIHGHEVGGTNPSLLESMASTRINLLYDVVFNREVGGDAALYWTKDNLNEVVDCAEQLKSSAVERYQQKAKEIIENRYTWGFIAHRYECLFTEGKE